MAVVIEVLFDGDNNVVGVRTIPQTLGQQTLATATQSYRQTKDSGLAEFIQTRTVNAIIDFSPKLTDQEKAEFKTIISTRQIGDTIRFAGAADAGPGVNPDGSVMKPLGDGGGGKTLGSILVFLDP